MWWAHPASLHTLPLAELCHWVPGAQGLQAAADLCFERAVGSSNLLLQEFALKMHQETPKPKEQRCHQHSKMTSLLFLAFFFPLETLARLTFPVKSSLVRFVSDAAPFAVKDAEVFIFCLCSPKQKALQLGRRVGCALVFVLCECRIGKMCGCSEFRRGEEMDAGTCCVLPRAPTTFLMDFNCERGNLLELIVQLVEGVSSQQNRRRKCWLSHLQRKLLPKWHWRSSRSTALCVGDWVSLGAVRCPRLPLQHRNQAVWLWLVDLSIGEVIFEARCSCWSSDLDVRKDLIFNSSFHFSSS